MFPSIRACIWLTHWRDDQIEKERCFSVGWGMIDNREMQIEKESYFFEKGERILMLERIYHIEKESCFCEGRDRAVT